MCMCMHVCVPPLTYGHSISFDLLFSYLSLSASSSSFLSLFAGLCPTSCLSLFHLYFCVCLIVYLSLFACLLHTFLHLPPSLLVFLKVGIDKIMLIQDESIDCLGLTQTWNT